MLGNKLEQEIVSVFHRDLTRTFSINEVSKKLGKAYPYVHKKASFFIKEGILKKIKIGNSFQCYLNLSDEKTHIFLSIQELNKRDSYIKQHSEIEELKKKLYEYTKNSSHKFLSVVINGKKIIFVSEDKISNASIFKFHDFESKIFTKQEFKKFLIDNFSSLDNIIVMMYTDGYCDILAEIGDDLLVKGLYNGLHSDE